MGRMTQATHLKRTCGNSDTAISTTSFSVTHAALRREKSTPVVNWAFEVGSSRCVISQLPELGSWRCRFLRVMYRSIARLGHSTSPGGWSYLHGLTPYTVATGVYTNP